MRGLLLLSDPHHAQMNPQSWIGEAQRLNINVQWQAAESCDPPLMLSSLQSRLGFLRSSWTCVLAEGRTIAYALILAAQLPVDRLILMGDQMFQNRCTHRSQRRINSFARRNLPLITAETVAVGMKPEALRRLASLMGCCSGGLYALGDGAELWQNRESFLTADLHAISGD